MKKLFTVLVLGLLFSCGDNDEPKKLEEQKPTEFPKFEIKTITENGIKKVSITDLYTSNLMGEKLSYRKFNLEKGKYVEGDDWDIAFYNRSIIVNGGTACVEQPYSTAILDRTKNGAIAVMGKMSYDDEVKPENLVITAKETDGDFLKVKEVPADVDFRQDSLNEFAIDDSSKGLFEYNLSPIEHIVTVKKNRFLIIRTHNGHYAKLKMLSYYEGAGATAQKSLETGTMEAGMIYANYFTFTYYYNTKEGDKRLQ